METASRLKEQQDKDISEKAPELEQLDFEFVLFSSAIIDYDYIMSLISKFTQPDTPKKEKMTKQELVDLVMSTSNFLDERSDIEEYINELDKHINSFDGNRGLTVKEVMEGYQKFKAEKSVNELIAVSNKHGLEPATLQAFVDSIMARMIFDGEKLSDLLEPLDLSWRDRTKKELELMEDLIPLLKKLANGREIVGLKAYE